MFRLSRVRPVEQSYTASEATAGRSFAEERLTGSEEDGFLSALVRSEQKVLASQARQEKWECVAGVNKKPPGRRFFVT